jgi:hypothetical protein
MTKSIAYYSTWVSHKKYEGKNANAILILNHWFPHEQYTLAWNKAIFVVIEIVPPWMIVLILILI